MEAKAKASYEEWCAKKRRERKENERLQAEAQTQQVNLMKCNTISHQLCSTYCARVKKIIR